MSHAPTPVLHINYREELNEEQYAAVTAPPGPLLVLAGAGSGKTRTLTYRVAYLVENGIAPERILLLTFTNKAAREMLSRVSSLLPHDMTSLWGGTFHSIGNRILRRHAQLVGLGQDYSILDAPDAKELLSACIPELGIDPKDKMFPKADAIRELFSFSVNTQAKLGDLLAGPYAHLSEFSEQLIVLSGRYAARKLKANAVDYDDLLHLPARLLTEHGEVAASYGRQFLYVLVDEYQDTNALQSSLVDRVAGAHGNIMVVGDDAQSIYSWRGANFENILEFEKRYTGAKIYRIETNYRSTPDILEVANASISHNTKQFPKNLRSVRPSTGKPALVPLSDASQQAVFIAQRVLELHEEGESLREIAVLYRAHSHAIELQLELTRRNIPFVITSGVQFFEQAHIKDITAFLRISQNPHDEIAFKRIVKLLPGIGDRAAEKLWGLLAGKTDWFSAKTGAKSQKSWDSVCEVRRQLADPPGQSGDKLIQWVMEGFYEDFAKLEYDNFKQRLDDVRQLQEFARQFETVPDFLAQVSLMTSVDYSRSRQEDSGDVLRLSTVHQAKGLEWNRVFVIMLCEGLFPLARCMAEPAQLEEERRLFYVAVTRARDELYLSYPHMRYLRGGSGEMLQVKSRFLSEIPTELCEEWEIAPPRPQWGQGECSDPW